MYDNDTKLRAAIVSMTAAVRLCRDVGIEPKYLLKLVIKEIFTPGGLVYDPKRERRL